MKRFFVAWLCLLEGHRKNRCQRCLDDLYPEPEESEVIFARAQSEMGRLRAAVEDQRNRRLSTVRIRQGYFLLQVRPAGDGPDWWPRASDGPAWATMTAEGGWTVGNDTRHLMPATWDEPDGMVDDLIAEWMEEREEGDWEFATLPITGERQEHKGLGTGVSRRYRGP